MARAKKMDKTVDYEKGVVSFKILSDGSEVVCDTNKLPAEIKSKLIPLAISHRIGDAAAGRDGKDAFESMSKVWDGLMKGNFTIRTAAKKGVSKADIKAKLDSLKGKEATAAAELLEKLGITL